MDQAFNQLFNIIAYYTLISLVFLCALAGLAFLSYGLIIWWRSKDREQKSLNFVLLQVMVPRDNEIKIDAMEQIIASLYSIKEGGKFKLLKTQPHISFELVAVNGEIKFFVCCPKEIQGLVEHQIHGGYPDAAVKPVDEYNIFNKQGKVAYKWLIQKKEPYFPLKTYKELSTDSLSSITASMAKLNENEGAAIQILISPAENDWKSSGKNYVSEIKKQEADPEEAKFKIDAETLEAIDSKTNKAGFETTIRIVVCSDTMPEAKSHLSNITSAFAQFSSPWNRLTSKKIWFKHSFMIDFLYRYQPIFWRGGQTILNSEEIASLFHFPNQSVEAPNIDWLKAKPAPPPPNLPKKGLYLGRSYYRGTEKPVYVKNIDRQRHFYIVGKTGTGKTELMKEMMIQDINAGRGVCLIDVHDLAEQILEYIPPERAEDVIYFNPSNTERPMGLNLLEAKTDDQKYFVATSVINLMYKLYDPYKTGIVGPRFEHAVRNAMLTAMSIDNATFMEVVKILQNPGGPYLKKILPQVKDPVVREYWTEQIAHTSDFHKSETLDYIVSKFGRFVTNKMMRNIIGQSKSAFNFRQVMDEGKILIIDLAKGKIGEENASFLGLVLIPRLLMAAMSRQDIPEEQRRDFYLYVDEFQNFATPDFAQILSEARKYHMNLTVANQFIGQMEEEVKNAIFGNVGTILSFRVGVTDANYLAREFQPIFDEQDLLNVERFHAYVKTMIDNEPVPPFSLNTTKNMKLDKKRRNPQLADKIKRLSVLKYGTAAEEVEREIRQRSAA